MAHLRHSMLGLLGDTFIEASWPGEQVLKIPFVTHWNRDDNFYLRVKSGNDDIHWRTLGGNHLFWSSRVFPHLWGLRTGCWTAQGADPSIWYVQTNRNRETLSKKLSWNLTLVICLSRCEDGNLWYVMDGLSDQDCIKQLAPQSLWPLQSTLN